MRAAGASSTLPLTENNLSITFEVDGRGPPKRGEETALDIRIVTPDYLRTMGIPLPRDRAGGPAVMFSDVAAATSHYRPTDFGVTGPPESIPTE